MNFPRRKPGRLKNFDYSENGAYFLTLCTKNKRKIFWKENAVYSKERPLACLSDCGLIAETELSRIEKIYSGNIKVSKYVIMPNHIHMIVFISNADDRTEKRIDIFRVIKQFKGSVSKQVGSPIWQKTYFDLVIRNEEDLMEIWRYIDENPLKLKQQFAE